jgi:hypothetical protein
VPTIPQIPCVAEKGRHEVSNFLYHKFSYPWAFFALRSISDQARKCSKYSNGTVRATSLVDLGTGACRGDKWAMRDNREKWMELCAQAAIEQDPQKLMELVEQITALLDAKEERLIERDSHRLRSERTD